jgi:hypothetical protein
MKNPCSETEPDNELVRELFARFGLAYYHGECLHRELCIVFAFSELPPRDFVTGPRVEELLARAYSLTLGDVAAKLKGVLPDELWGDVLAAVERRNFLAHRFWFERVHLMFSTSNLQQVIADLNGSTKLFDGIDARIREWSEPRLAELGVTQELRADALTRVLSGEDDEPLPDGQTLRELDKKLRGQQKLVRVWEFALDGELKPLIFELEDTSLWQLSDVGLGITRFQKIGSGWTERPEVKPYLPANILPRPKVSAAWKYEWKLAKGATLWVRPGRRERTFEWGLRQPRKSKVLKLLK